MFGTACIPRDGAAPTEKPAAGSTAALDAARNASCETRARAALTTMNDDPTTRSNADPRRARRLGALRRRSPTRRRTGFRRPRRRRRRRHRPRWRAAGDAQVTSCSSASRRARAQRPVRRLRRVGWRARRRRCGARVPSPGPDLRTRGRGAPTTGVSARAMYRGGLSRRRPGAQQLQLPHDAGRLIMESGAHAHRLHGVPGRRRPDRAAAAGDRRAAARRLHRHAELPAHPDREGGRDGRRHLEPAQGA